MKRGQIAMFVLFAILIVGAIVLFFVFSGGILSNASSEEEIINSVVLGCAKDVSLEVVRDIGITGGYYDSDYDFILYGVPVYKDGMEIKIPSLEFIEGELAKDFDYKLKNCVLGYSSFADFEFEVGEASSSVGILDEKVIFNIGLPVKVFSENRVELTRDFGEVIVDVRLKDMHEVAGEIAREENAQELCLTCLARLAQENDFNISSFNYKENSFFVVIRSKEINDEVFDFIFGIRA